MIGAEQRMGRTVVDHPLLAIAPECKYIADHVAEPARRQGLRRAQNVIHRKRRRLPANMPRPRVVASQPRKMIRTTRATASSFSSGTWRFRASLRLHLEDQRRTASDRRTAPVVAIRLV
jgi:hypothetical protein